MVSSETVHVRNVFSAKLVYAFVSVLFCFVCFLMKTKSRMSLIFFLVTSHVCVVGGEIGL